MRYALSESEFFSFQLSDNCQKSEGKNNTCYALFQINNKKSYKYKFDTADLPYQFVCTLASRPRRWFQLLRPL